MKNRLLHTVLVLRGIEYCQVQAMRASTHQSSEVQSWRIGSNEAEVETLVAMQVRYREDAVCVRLRDACIHSLRVAGKIDD